MKPNFFVAFPIVTTRWFNELVPEVPPGVRRFHPHDLHITIAFLGACGIDVAERIWNDAQHAKFAIQTVRLGPVVPMGNPSRPSALSALITEGNDALSAYMQTHQNPWRIQAGHQPDLRPPKPHCTIARPKRRASTEERDRALRWAQNIATEGEPIQLGPLALYTWAENRTEQLFQILAQAQVSLD